MDNLKYNDKRSAFFREWFQHGLTYEEYLQACPAEHAQKWRSFEGRIALADPQHRLLSGFSRTLNLLVLSGVWCGDCARQGPMLHEISKAASVVVLRFVENRPNPELSSELRINGAEKVPVVVALSEDFFELERFGDRHLSVYRKKARTELGPACDSGIVGRSDDELATELGEWVNFVERLQWMLRLAPALRARYGD